MSWAGWEPWDKSAIGVADLKEDYIPGDLGTSRPVLVAPPSFPHPGFDPFSYLKTPGSFPAEFNTESSRFKDLRTKELQNGRLAMIAAAGMVAQEVAKLIANNYASIMRSQLIDGRPILDHLLKFGLSYAPGGTNL